MADAGDVVVVGAGIGGLCAAIAIAAAGRPVRVYEAGSVPGGKAGSIEIDGVRVDTGPSVLTLPRAFDRVLALAGTTLADEVTLIAPEPAFRYRYPDGVVLDVFTERERTLASIEAALGPAPASELASFLDYAAGIWEAASPSFVEGPAPGLLSVLNPSSIRGLVRIDPVRTMRGAIVERVRSPHVRDLLLRYATYNGSDPRRAPAALNCIAHVELGLGGFGVRGGIRALVDALVRVAVRTGVEIRCDTPIRRILTSSGRVSGVRTDAGDVPARHVVCNADVAHLTNELLPPRATSLGPPDAPSTSGWTAILRAPRRSGADARVAHEVVFPKDYAMEFVDLFDRDQPPDDPTVYLCAQGPAHGNPGWADAEAVFVMANAPAEPTRGARDPEVWRGLEDRVLKRLDAVGLGGTVVWRRTPTDLAAQFPGTRGALYGAASNGPFAAFRRPPNRVREVPGLYLASGSAHPGGGLPLCAWSGAAAAAALLEDS